jgi:hypothetical protein
MEGTKPMVFELMKAIVKTAGSGLREVILETHLYMGKGCGHPQSYLTESLVLVRGFNEDSRKVTSEERPDTS